MKKVVFFSALSAAVFYLQPITAIANPVVYKTDMNCSYKGKKASQKCLVVFSDESSAVSPISKKIYGSNEYLDTIIVYWPDGDTSKYLSIGYNKYINLNSKKGTIYTQRGGSNEIILDSASWGQNYIRLWN